jgi:hypothetical protein
MSEQTLPLQYQAQEAEKPKKLRRAIAVPFTQIALKCSWVVLGLCSGFQVIMFPTPANSMAVTYILFAWMIVSLLYIRIKILKKYPLSSFLMIGFTATQFYLPLLFTTLENKPVTYNLMLPGEVFFHSALALIVLITANCIYRFLFRRSFARKSDLLYKAGLFNAPGDLQLWLMGGIGLLAFVYVYFLSPSVGREVTGSALDKFIQGLIPFSYAPYFIPFGKMYGNNKKQTKNFAIWLAVFTAMLFVVSIGKNSRAAFMLGFTSLGFSYILGLLLGMFKPKFFTVKNGVLAAVGFWFITGPLADLGTAMVNVREQRNDISAMELVGRTIEAFNDKEGIEKRRKSDNLNQDSWDERYLDNVFTARFANIKFNDASLVEQHKIGENNYDLYKFSVNYAWSTLPQPFLDKLGVEIKKSDLRALSFGDYIYYLAEAPVETLGGFRTGHFAGTGMGAFGWWYLLILGLGIIPVFFLMDKLSIITVPSRSGRRLSKHPSTGLRFSLCGLLSISGVFMFLPAESVMITIDYIVRGWIQMVLLYLIIFHVTKYIRAFILKMRT